MLREIMVLQVSVLQTVQQGSSLTQPQCAEPPNVELSRPQETLIFSILSRGRMEHAMTGHGPGSAAETTNLTHPLEPQSTKELCLTGMLCPQDAQLICLHKGMRCRSRDLRASGISTVGSRYNTGPTNDLCPSVILTPLK